MTLAFYCTFYFTFYTIIHCNVHACVAHLYIGEYVDSLGNRLV